MDNNELLQAMFSEANVGIIVADREGNILKANPYAAALFGYEEEEFKNKKVEELLPHALQSRHRSHRESYHKNPTPRAMGDDLPLLGLKKSGENFPIKISLSYTVYNQATYAIAYISDDTIQKNILKELKDSQDSLNEAQKDLELKIEERTQKLRASESKLKDALEKEKELSELKSRFVSMASHEFRTPLASILSSASLISRYTQEDQQDKRMKHVNRIDSSVRNLTTILNDFLSLEKLESGKVRFNPVEVNFTEYIQSILDEVNLITKANQKVIHSHTGSSQISIDEHLLKNILINLLSNGIKYSPVGENVELNTTVRSNGLHIEVKDYGIGIPEEDQKHMFTRFFRANNVSNVQGTGLGLTIVKRYLDLMEGDISFTSKEGEGTTFVINISI